jgi:hypothetical protein
VIVKLPITDGSFQTIQHKDVIHRFVHTCQQVGGLLPALMAACDIMVSDYHGNRQDAVYWYKAVYMKYASTRQEAICVILSEVPKLSCYEDGQRIYWGAEMKGSNKPPAKKQYALAVPQVQKVYMDGPNGGTDISVFQRVELDEVAPMAISNVSFDKVTAFAQCAAQGGSGIQKIVQGHGLQLRFSLEAFIAHFHEIWFQEDYEALMKSPMVKHFCSWAFTGDLDKHKDQVLRLLCACALPYEGLTLAKATVNFHTAEFTNAAFALQTFACFSVWQVRLCNVKPVPSRLLWNLSGNSIAPIVQDADPYFVEGYGTAPAHNCNMAQFFCITDEGLMLPEHSLGCVFQQHLKIMTASELQDFSFQHFSRLAQQAGTASAYKDAQAALMQSVVRQQQMAQMEQLQQQMAQFSSAPLQLQSSSSSTAVPPTVASAAARAAAAAAAGSDGAVAAAGPSVPPSCPAAGDPTVLQPGTPATSSSAQQVQLTQQGPHHSAAHHSAQQDSEEWKQMHAARAELKKQQQSF